MKLFGTTFQTLEQSLQYASAKNKAISSNIANVDTPNYKKKDVAFKTILDGEINITAKQTHAKHIPFNNNSRQSYIVTNHSNTVYNHNGNNVDIDKEMSELAKNQIYYQSLVDRINGKFGSLQSVIRGGR